MKIKFKSKYRNSVFALIMSFCTALLVSGVITFINAPTTTIFIERWPFNFILGWPLVFASILLIAPLVNKLVSVMTE
jgi:Protein of unknown function (DUF2798)